MSEQPQTELAVRVYDFLRRYEYPTIAGVNKGAARRFAVFADRARLALVPLVSEGETDG
jgi:hypothetical protein